MNEDVLTAQPQRPRRATPRPVFDRPTVIRAAQAAQHLWGDPESGFVSDRVYVSTDTLHSLQFTLPPGGRFVHSATNPTVFAADVSYTVLSGTLWITDPEHGEVRRVRAGQSVLYRRDTWHHAFNPSPDPVVVLEFFAPPPSRGTASTYAKRQPLLEASSYDDRRWERRWPEARSQAEAVARLIVVDESTCRWRIVDDRAGHTQAVMVDTEHLTLCRGVVAPGHVGEELVIEDEAMLYVDAGALSVLLPDVPEGGQAWFGLEPGDAVFLTAGSTLRLVDLGGRGASYWLGMARPTPADWAP